MEEEDPEAQSPPIVTVINAVNISCKADRQI